MGKMEHLFQIVPMQVARFLVYNFLNLAPYFHNIGIGYSYFCFLKESNSIWACGILAMPTNVERLDHLPAFIIFNLSCNCKAL